MLEANTIVGSSQESFRVARATQERRIVRRMRSFRRLFLVIEGYDPRVHVLFFCPQLYKYDQDSTLVPLRGDEIGNFIAQAIADKAARRRPWYHPAEAIPSKPLIEAAMLEEFDTLAVEAPALVPLLPAPLEAGIPEREAENTLVLRTRSSHHNCRESGYELRVQSGTRIIELLVSFDSEVRIGAGCTIGRTSESGH